MQKDGKQKRLELIHWFNSFFMLQICVLLQLNQNVMGCNIFCKAVYPIVFLYVSPAFSQRFLLTLMRGYIMCFYCWEPPQQEGQDCFTAFKFTLKIQINSISITYYTSLSKTSLFLLRGLWFFVCHLILLMKPARKVCYLYVTWIWF